MKPIVALCFVTLLLSLMGCSGHPTTVRLTGEFAHIDQGDFFIYSSDGGMPGMDTLHIREGKFAYEFTLDRPATFHILYPNFSQLAIFAQGGDDIHVVGDAQSLSEVKVEGSMENELYTQFRADILGKTDTMAVRLAGEYALQYPTTRLSRFLLTTYYLHNDSLSRSDIAAVYDSLLRANPDDLELSTLAPVVNRHHLLQVGQPLPHFSLPLRSNAFTLHKADSVVSDTMFRGKNLLLIFWANWYPDSRTALWHARKHRIKTGMKKQVMLSYSLDTSESALRKAEQADTVTYASYCDFRAFASPLVQRWGITDLPYYIYTDTLGTIIASGSDWKNDVEPYLGWDKEKE